MADSSKRQSTAGKTATPKAAPGLNEASLDALSKAVGARVQITTTLQNHTVEGSIFTVCPLNSAIAVDSTPVPPNPATAAANQPGDYHIIPLANIQSFKILSLAGLPARADGYGSGTPSGAVNVTKVDMQALKAREEAEIQRLKQREEMKGRGVTKEAQEIFDHFNRMYQTRWHGTTIIVDESVLVEPPYKTENCKAPKDKPAAALPQIKKVLEGYYQKKKAGTPPVRESRPPPATPMPRKGG
jgi:hypothetical protein